MSRKFRERSTGDFQKSEIVIGALTSVTLCDVGRNRYRRATKLSDESELFGVRQSFARPVHLLSKTHGLLPGNQVPKCFDLTDSQSPFLTGSPRGCFALPSLSSVLASCLGALLPPCLPITPSSAGPVSHLPAPPCSRIPVVPPSADPAQAGLSERPATSVARSDKARCHLPRWSG